MRGLWDERFTPADAEIIKRKARKLVGHHGYRASDVEDIQQDLATHVFQQTHRHLPERGSREKFVSKVAKNKLLHLIEQRTAKKRDRRGERRLNEVCEWELRDQTQSKEKRDLTMGVQGAVASLPENLRPIAVLFMQMNEAQIMRETGLSREKVRGMRRRIQRHLRALGLAPKSED